MRVSLRVEGLADVLEALVTLKGGRRDVQPLPGVVVGFHVGDVMCNT
jgi:hypothetical protein